MVEGRMSRPARDTDREAVVTGIGCGLPARVVTNDDLAARLDTTDEWIRSRSGIHQRHVVDPGTATSDLAVMAGVEALAADYRSGGSGKAELVVVATTTPDRPCPATAPLVAARLGLGPVPAFDLNAVCSGFLYAVFTAEALIVSGAAESALVIGADTFSTIVDPDDRRTAFLFGDGAGAMVLRPGSPGSLHAMDLGSDGGLEYLIIVPEGGSRVPTAAGARDRWFAMQGQAVYRHAVDRMSRGALSVLDKVGWGVGDVDRFVGHQADRRILDAVARRIDLPPDRLVVNVDRVGNTAAASIPLALAQAAESGDLRGGHRVVLAAFGGGATWGAAALTWPRLG
jgi:3-oxoacyl-[acyl-carrier-protein] synthase-3